MLSLAKLSWTLIGWRPFSWRSGKSMETGSHLRPDFPAVPAAVPGSVQAALQAAGHLADPLLGQNYLAAQWVEHYHWDFSTTLPPQTVAPGAKVLLDAPGLDYSGWLLIDCKVVAEFRGALLPHRFDLTAQLSDGKPHALSFVFDLPPEDQGQIGYTSRSRIYKPRYSFSWDWCPRLVPIGIWEPPTLRSGAEAGIELLRLRTELAEDLATGQVQATIACDLPGLALTATLYDGSRQVGVSTTTLKPGENRIQLQRLPVEPWFPNTLGNPKVYQVRLQAARDGQVIWEASRQVGFRRIQWQQCQDAPPDAEPWLCLVNGRPVFLQGANWVPPTHNYIDSTPADYRTLLDLYRDMGANILRVWGGGIPEREVFYDLCDRAGILVWQEFPLSSSGIDNRPPDDPASIADLCAIAKTYIHRLAHHPALLLWCGGNELQVGLDGAPAGSGKPCDRSYPALAALAALTAADDPERKFVPTSSSGPRFYAEPANFGKGLHHDVHGPWGWGGMKDRAAWIDYWSRDDSLLRSEVGFPGASGLETFDRYTPGGSAAVPWPPLDPAAYPAWAASAWWIQWDRFGPRLPNLPPRQALDRYIALTQAEQADLLAIAAAACKNRFPRCAGFIVWMGHDLYPCFANNSLIDMTRTPKPAYHALRAVFRAH